MTALIDFQDRVVTVEYTWHWAEDGSWIEIDRVMFNGRNIRNYISHDSLTDITEKVYEREEDI